MEAQMGKRARLTDNFFEEVRDRDTTNSKKRRSGRVVVISSVNLEMPVYALLHGRKKVCSVIDQVFEERQVQRWDAVRLHDM